MAVVGCSVVAFAASPARADIRFGSQQIDIVNVQVGSPVMTTTSNCQGFVRHDVPVIPVTIEAIFIPPPGQTPVGPYAVGNWTGGFGGVDDHYGTGQAHSFTQFFHLQLTTDPTFHGPGYYELSAIVQDVGLASGFDERDDILVHIPAMPPSSAHANVKCSQVDDASKKFKEAIEGKVKGKILNTVLDTTFGSDVAGTLKSYWGNVMYVNNVLDALALDEAVDDPPDNDYQQLAVAVAPPTPPDPTGLSPGQQSALDQYMAAAGSAIGAVRALYTTENRVWGADNAGSQYWYDQQMAHLATLANQAATDLDALGPLGAALRAAANAGVPNFSFSLGDAIDALSAYDHGVPAEDVSAYSALGLSPAEQHELANDALTIDPDEMVTADGLGTLVNTDNSALADDLREVAGWASGTIEEARPVIASVTPNTESVVGGDMVTIAGVNLADVTGVNFGSSSPGQGQGVVAGCTDTSCDVIAPPGTGTVDVVAVGAGGPSAIGPDDRLTYQPGGAAAVSAVLPAMGSTAGGTAVTILGTGLTDGTVYFGPTVAADWGCIDTECQADSPPSASAGPVDVTVVTPSSTSAVVPADAFTYDSSPAPPDPPTVTAVSPNQGADTGGDTITVTGTNLDGATEVDVGPSSAFVPVDSTHLRVTTPEHPAGTVNVRVLGPGGSSAISIADRFTYQVLGTPTVTSVSPSSGSVLGGTSVTITGTDLNGGSFAFGSSYAGDAVCTATSCTLSSPPAASAGAVDVIVTNGDGRSSSPSSADRFTYSATAAPVVTGVNPDVGLVSGGSSVVIDGTNFNSVTDVVFGTGPPQPATCSTHVCTAVVPAASAGSVDVRVTNSAGTSAVTLADRFNYVTSARPVVTAVSPSSGDVTGLNTVEVYGSNLLGGQVFFGSQPGFQVDAGQDCSNTLCEVGAPDASTTGPVHVTVETASGTSATSSADLFTYLQPVVTSISPSTGYTDGGAVVTVIGSDLSGDTVYFGAEPDGDSTCTDTQCTATAPSVATAGPVDVRVISTYEATSPVTAADRFTYYVRPSPTVTAVSPASGTDEGDDTVTVSGTDLAGGRVWFGSTEAYDQTCTATSCTATSPASEDPDANPIDGPVDVTVVTSAGTSAVSSADRFTYHRPGVPTVTAISPTSGSVVGGTPFTVSGTNLTNALVFVDGQLASDVTCQVSLCTATTPAAAAAGVVDVTVHTSAGTSSTSSHDRFAYVVPPTPIITSVSPAIGPASGGTIVTITGTDLAGASIKFGSVSVTDASCTDTSCEVKAPAASPGVVHVRAATPGGTSATSTADQFTYSAVSISEIALPPSDTDTGASGSGRLSQGIGGDMWFTIPQQSEVAKVTPGGTITDYPTVTPDSSPLGIAEGSDGRMWYTEENPNRVVAIDSHGTQTEYPVPGQPGDARGPALGADGRIWFALNESAAMAAVSTTGVVTVYKLPDPSSNPINTTLGSDGRVWFTDHTANAIGAITTSGHVTEYPLPETGTEPWDIASGPDGRLWFTESGTGAVGAITTSGQVTEYPTDGTLAVTTGITSGPDGRLWFTDPSVDQVSAITPATGAIADYGLPGGALGEGPKYLGMAADGSLYVTELDADNVAHLTGLTTGVAPAVTFVNPASAATTGGSKVTITGANLTAATSVTFGSVAATSVTVLDAAHVTAVVPAHAAGTVDVRVTTPAGTTSISSADRFTFGAGPAPTPVVAGVSPATGSTTGGQVITVSGTGLTGGAVDIGGAAATAVICSDTSCTATTPAGAAGTVDVTLTTAGGTSEHVVADQFTYQLPAPPPPAITGVSPASGSAAGGTTVTLTGTNLSGGLVRFGLNQALGSCSSTSCTVTSPAGGQGSVNVTVTTAGGTSAWAVADTFTYGAATPTVPGAPTGVNASAGDGSAIVAWVPPVSNGGSALTSFTASASPGSQTCTVSAPQDFCTVSGLSNGTAYTFTVTASNAVGAGPSSAPSPPVTPTAGPGDSFHSVSPVRLLDSRPGVGNAGGYATPWGPATAREVHVGGVGGVPVDADAVVLNVTVTDPTTAGYLSIYPSGASRPTVSSLNFTAGETIPNQVTVKLGTGGRISIYNFSGNVDVVADVTGYYDSGSGDGFTSVSPTRILDSRPGVGNTGGYSTPWSTATTRDVQVGGLGGVPANADAVVLNVTVTGTTGSSYLSLWPQGSSRPTVSSLNWTAGETIPNAVTVKLNAGNGKVSVFNLAGNADVIVDVAGYFLPGTGKLFHPLAPARVLDSRPGVGNVGGYATPWGSGTTRSLAMVGAGGVPSGADTVVVNATVTDATAASYLSMWPEGGPRPVVSSLNWVAGETIANAASVKLSGGGLSLYNAGGQVDVICDVAGYYA